MRISRRDVLAAGTAAASSMLLSDKAMSSFSSPNQAKFKLKYGPHFGMFQNHAPDILDQLRFAADQGFHAWEDNGMMGRPVEQQEAIAKTMSQLGITMGVFVAHAEWQNPTYALGGKETMDNLRKEASKAVEVAKRVNATWMTVVPGPYDKRLAWDYQTANVVDCLKAMAEVLEPHGLIMVLEALNPYRDHPGMFLSKIPQGYMISKAVNSPACKILDDLYHQQITEGNLIPNMNMAWSEIAYFQVGDNPGRNEPLTGEVNFRNIFKHIASRSTEFVIGMEHGNSQGGKEGEQKVIDAYRWCDDF